MSAIVCLQFVKSIRFIVVDRWTTRRHVTSQIDSQSASPSVPVYNLDLAPESRRFLRTTPSFGIRITSILFIATTSVRQIVQNIIMTMLNEPQPSHCLCHRCRPELHPYINNPDSRNLYHDDEEIEPLSCCAMTELVLKVNREEFGKAATCISNWAKNTFFNKSRWQSLFAEAPLDCEVSLTLGL